MSSSTGKNKLERRYGLGHLHFITCSCYRKLPFFASEQRRDVFLKILREVRDRYDFALLGYVVMPEHIHLLISEPNIGTPSLVMQVLKQRVSRALRKRPKNASPAQFRLWNDQPLSKYPRFWQRRFYDFNVWSSRKKNEKLNYMHFNPVRRGPIDQAGGAPSTWRELTPRMNHHTTRQIGPSRKNCVGAVYPERSRRALVGL